ncbi:MAG: hypothetical protein WCP52_07290 [Bacteroidota bacterium]
MKASATKFQQKYLTDLQKINELIDENKLEGNDGALEKFKQHISEVSNIGRFSIQNWDIKWRDEVYTFGTKFEKKIDPVDFLKLLSADLNNKNKDKKEVLDFYYSEIEGNSLPEDAFTKRIEALIEKYPFNPEFRHSYGHFLKDKHKYEEAIKQYSFALEKDKKNDLFMENLFGCYHLYFDDLLSKSEYTNGITTIDKLFQDEVFKDEIIFHNILISTKQRFKDYITIDNKIEKAEKDIKEIVKSETLKGQNKLIEVLGFFTAIIAFIFSTVSTAKAFAFNEAIIFNISLGITLIIFALSISILFSIKEVKRHDFRKYLLGILVLCLISIVYTERTIQPEKQSIKVKIIRVYKK